LKNSDNVYPNLSNTMFFCEKTHILVQSGVWKQATDT